MTSPITSDEKRTRVEALAYAIWEDNGRPEGHSLDYWLRAERQVDVECDLVDRFFGHPMPARHENSRRW